jgi:hypothetical protein
MLQVKDLSRVDVLPPAECLVPDTVPKSAVPKIGATAALIVLLQPTLPEVDQASNGNDTGQPPKKQCEHGAARPAVATDIDDVNRLGRSLRLGTVLDDFRGTGLGRSEFSRTRMHRVCRWRHRGEPIHER